MAGWGLMRKLTSRGANLLASTLLGACVRFHAWLRVFFNLSLGGVVQHCCRMGAFPSTRAPAACFFGLCKTTSYARNSRPTSHPTILGGGHFPGLSIAHT